MSSCPSCGRDVGSHVTCPHCGANLKRRLTISLFGLLAILLAVGGLGLLWYVSVNTALPTIRIGQIQAAQNYAYVRLDGVVKRSPRFNPDSEALTFWIDDGSGQMLVSAFRSDARALIAADRVPALGDRISVAGTLRVRDDTPSLTLNSPDALTLSRAIDAAQARELGALSAADAFTAVTVRGQVRAVREPPSAGGLRLLTIRDATGEIDVAISADMASWGAPAPEVQTGASIEVTGVVTLYEDEPQLTLTRGDGLAQLSEPIEIAQLTPIRGLGDDDLSRWVRVQGTIAKIAPFSAGVKFTLNDVQGQDLILLLWQDVFEALPDSADWQIGAEVAAQGQLNSFRGELELVPEVALDVAILNRAIVEAPPTLNLTGIGTITQEDLGQMVFISGTIESADRFTSGVRFRVEDHTGSILLVLFSNVYEQIETGDRLEDGVSVSALGRVSEFNGALEIVPPNGASVRVLLDTEIAQVTPTPPPAPTAIPLPTLTPGNVTTGTFQPTPLPSLTGTPSLTPLPDLTGAPAPTPLPDLTATAALTPAAGEVMTIGSLDASRIGQQVTVRGQVISASSFSAGFRFTLNDNSGSIQLVLFDGRYRELTNRAELNLGAQVSVRAMLAEFNGALELQPAVGSDVSIEQPGSSSIVKTRAINTLSTADVGTLAAVIGDVLRVEGFSSGISVFVNDGTGELRIVIFNNVLNYVPNAPALQAGAKVRVTGRVDEFNGALELVPALGYDVAVNP
ncbi:MAG TPA: OB-fold nucleic acid binding domain-containing protein [Anaerolineae bacterium]|nr:OB-fold nucleic acid binding domain-containing protein [Anaerolineae bacterium]